MGLSTTIVNGNRFLGYSRKVVANVLGFQGQREGRKNKLSASGRAYMYKVNDGPRHGVGAGLRRPPL